MLRQRHAPNEVPSATSLPAPAREDHSARVRNYLVSMGIRTLCFLLAIVLEGWARWTCVALAVVLPYVAVVLANATQQRRIDRLGAVTPSDVEQLGRRDS